MLSEVDDPPGGADGRCSVCDRPLQQAPVWRAWISLRVATDVLPLPVRACSRDCVENLPTPAKGYVQHPHRGVVGSTASRLRQPLTAPYEVGKDVRAVGPVMTWRATTGWLCGPGRRTGGPRRER
jgi:hypothetical protein